MKYAGEIISNSPELQDGLPIRSMALKLTASKPGTNRKALSDQAATVFSDRSD